MMVPYVGTSRREVRIENAISKLNAFAHGQGALQGKACNLIFAHECDAGMGLSVDDELFEHRSARGTTRDAVVRAHSETGQSSKEKADPPHRPGSVVTETFPSTRRAPEITSGSHATVQDETGCHMVHEQP
jgi:hypothetical protein